MGALCECVFRGGRGGAPSTFLLISYLSMCVLMVKCILEQISALFVMISAS